MQVTGAVVRVASRPDIVASKEWADRPKDREARPQVLAGTVEDLHTFFVVAGASYALTHNCGLGRGDSFARYLDDNGGGVLATLGDDGMLDLVIVKSSTSPSGASMFVEALQAFDSGAVDGIRGTWIGGGSLSDNYDSYRTAVARGLSPEEAALSTFTGKMAFRNGFTRVEVVSDAAEKLVVEFRR
jgi:hypothetical protein